ncbi:N-acetylmuramoyl-L-alanine amidase [Nocardioides sp. MH1]|uniref:N-acetylmuramoyl-L-alanine amidase family protein n=1 Tax=Nocardioides sp. MH1 TaxID=3242490 RepID=UPI0035205E88
MSLLVGPALALTGCADGSSGADAPTASGPIRSAPTSRAAGTTTEPGATMSPEQPLAGRVIVIDPGHQLGNSSFHAEIDAPVEAGGFTKPCNTTGTSTDGGFPEATFAWEVARQLRRLLVADGARVELTRHSNSASAWGPCVDVRGRAGNPGAPGPTADLKISIHADGSYASGAHGFHVIAPTEVAPWTTDIAGPSLRLARVVRDSLVDHGFATSTYTATDGIALRGDLATLNLADIPTVLVELGNMRDAGDAATMTSAAGREDYASALASAVERFSAR